MPTPTDFSLYELGKNAWMFIPFGGLRISAIEIAKISILMGNKGTYQGK